MNAKSVRKAVAKWENAYARKMAVQAYRMHDADSNVQVAALFNDRATNEDGSQDLAAVIAWHVDDDDSNVVVVDRLAADCGKGFGSSLLRGRLHAWTGVYAYVEVEPSPDALGFYEKFGFVHNYEMQGREVYTMQLELTGEGY